jgi:poly-gamma-glutamate capsule biosynthesis protein CapA/YwtB (metallophosphatase superfamily)
VKAAFAQAGLVLGIFLLVVVSLPPAGHSLQLAFTGDVMLGRGVAQAHSDGDWGRALGAVEPHTTDVDLAFANLESPITSASLTRDTYDLRAPPQAGLALAAAGLHVVSLANNHISDSGPRGIEDTLHALDSAGITPIGHDDEPWKTQVKGIRMTWYAFDDTLQPLDSDKIQQAFASVRDRSDLLIVSIHWGGEGQAAPNTRQRQLAQSLAAAGADIIIGHHPHLLQPTEWIWGAGRGRPTFVAYSLGNALFDQGAPPGARYGALLLLDADRLGVKDACLIPFQIDPQTWNTTTASPQATEAITHALRLDPCLGEDDPAN